MTAVPWPVEQGLLTAFSFVAFVLVSIPLYWHLEAWNVGCVLYMFWTGSTCLIQFINGVIWRRDAIDYAPVWCDISIRIQYAASIGIIAASLVINRRLYKIASITSVSITRAQRRRSMYIDIALGLSLPILSMILMWFVQGHRYNIYEGIGCLAAIPNSIPSNMFQTGFSIMIGVASTFYCAGTLRAFYKRRRQFSELLASSSNLTFNRYFRLMALASIEMLATIPLGVWLLVTQLTQVPIYEWRGLADMHWGFSRVFLVPYIQWSMIPGQRFSMTIGPWLSISCAFVFFVFFGLADEAKIHYRLAFSTVAKKFGYSSGGVSSTNDFNPSKGSKLGVSIPSFVNGGGSISGPQTSVSDFSDKLSMDIELGPDVFDEKKTYSFTETSSGSVSYANTPIDNAEMELPLSRPDSEVISEPLPVPRHSVDAPRSVSRDIKDMV